MRIVKYLLEHKVTLLLIFCLLIAQAFCDLSLPNYTSQIVDTGIQQHGVEDAATSVMTQRTHDAASMLIDPAQQDAFDEAYALNGDGYYELTDKGYENRSDLDDALALPLVIIQYADQLENFDLEQTLQAYQAGVIDKEQITAAVEQVKDKVAISDTLLAQQAITAAQAEYEACGVSLDDVQMDYLKRIGLTMLAMAALMLVCSALVGLLASVNGARIARSLRERLFTKVMQLSEHEIDGFSSASLITRGTNDIQQIQFVIVMLQRMVLYAPILAIGGIIMVCRTNPSMGWIVAVAIVAVFALCIGLMMITMPKFKIMQELVDRVNLVSREILTGLPVIRAFGREEHEQQRFEQANNDLMKTQLFTNRVMAFMMPGMSLVMNLTSCAIVWVGGHYVDAGTIQTGDLIAFITYAMIIVLGFLMIGMIAILLPRANVAAGRVNEVINCEPGIKDVENTEVAEQVLKSDGPGATITFKDVCFGYANADDYAIDHVSFTAEAGKTCAIIGPTGCGKSTLIKLIERFYDVNEGSIEIDGVDIRKMSQKTLRSMLGYSPQQAFLFSGTVQSNVSYSNPEMPAEQLQTAIDVAQASEFIESRDEGLQSAIAQSGSNVSGGQRQRLSIARALATDARAYLFDDSFSALDYKTDAKLRADLAEKLKGKTVLIVAQRIATIMNADNIVVLDDGRIVGQGTHRELLESCPVYQQIASSQLSKEELERGGAR